MFFAGFLQRCNTLYMSDSKNNALGSGTYKVPE